MSSAQDLFGALQHEEFEEHKEKLETLMTKTLTAPEMIQAQMRIKELFPLFKVPLHKLYPATYASFTC